MNAESSGRYKLAILLFITVILVFLIATDMYLVSRLRSQLFNEEYNNAEYEIEMVELFVREPLLQNHYDEVEQFLLQWQEEHNDVVAIEAVMPNGFKLVELKDTKAVRNSYEIQKHIQYLNNNLISIRVVKEFTHAGLLWRLQMQLIIGSFILTAFFGLTLWFTIRKFALLPLERSRDSLEVIVRERTKTWEEANKNLLAEIAAREKTQKTLNAKITELEEFYNMAVGREIKMKTLKEEIAKLKSALNNRSADKK